MVDYNVVLVTVDCLRRDHLGSWGYSRDTTPNIDGVVERALVFNNMVSNGNCTPASFPSIMASTYPAVSGSILDMLPRGCHLISERLKERGYTTIGIHSNPFLSSRFGYGRGYDIYEDLQGKTGYCSKWVPRIKGVLSRVLQRAPYFHEVKSIIRQIMSYNPYVWANEIVDRSIHHLSSVKGPFFLWAHFMDAHFPYMYPEYDDKHVYTRISKLRLGRVLGDANRRGAVTDGQLQDLMDLYDTNLRYIDFQIGRLLSFFHEKGVEEDTILIITSDHGEEFMEHGNVFHCNKLYNEFIQVPLVIRHPEIDEKVGVDVMMSHLDVAPSILDFLGAREDPLFGGKSVLKKMEIGGEGKVFSEGLSLSFNKPVERLFSCTTRDMKYIYNYSEKHLEAYDLVNDAQERQDISGEALEHPSSDALFSHIESRVSFNRLSVENDVTRQPFVSPCMPNDYAE